MTFEDGAAFEEVEPPPDFVIPNPKPPRGESGRFARKPAGDKADNPKRVKPAIKVPNRKGQFIAPVTAIYMGIGGMLMPFDPICANSVLQAAENCAQVWDELAYQNEAVRRFLFSITQVSLTGKLFLAHSPILMAVAIHHFPPAQRVMGQMGEKMAETIAEQMRANGEAPPDAD